MTRGKKGGKGKLSTTMTVGVTAFLGIASWLYYKSIELRCSAGYWNDPTAIMFYEVMRYVFAFAVLLFASTILVVVAREVFHVDLDFLRGR